MPKHQYLVLNWADMSNFDPLEVVGRGGDTQHKNTI